MQAAAVLAGAVIVAGVYLAIAATLGFSTSWIALGILAIAVAASIGMMTAGSPTRPMSR